MYYNGQRVAFKKLSPFVRRRIGLSRERESAVPSGSEDGKIYARDIEGYIQKLIKDHSLRREIVKEQPEDVRFLYSSFY